LGLGAVGCSSDKTKEQIAAMNTSNAQRVANIYAGFQNGKGGAGPKDEAEFKAFIREYDPAKLSAMGIDPGNLDKVFTSERDGKPFTIRYKVGGGRGAVAPVVFEKDGVNGMRQVGFTGGKVEEVDEARYKDLLAGKSGTEPPAGGPPTGPPAGGGTRPGGSGPPPGAPTGPPKG
jgi:hypothetical protein